MFSCCSSKKNGIKVYYSGDIIDNNIRNGFGKLYDTDKKLIYSGQWLNNKKHGKGTEYLKYGIYVGEFNNNQKIGYCIFKWDNGNVFNGIINKTNKGLIGDGELSYSNNDKYVGKFLIYWDLFYFWGGSRP